MILYSTTTSHYGILFIWIMQHWFLLEMNAPSMFCCVIIVKSQHAFFGFCLFSLSMKQNYRLLTIYTLLSYIYYLHTNHHYQGHTWAMYIISKYNNVQTEIAILICLIIFVRDFSVQDQCVLLCSSWRDISCKW